MDTSNVDVRCQYKHGHVSDTCQIPDTYLHVVDMDTCHNNINAMVYAVDG